MWHLLFGFWGARSFKLFAWVRDTDTQLSWADRCEQMADDTSITMNIDLVTLVIQCSMIQGWVRVSLRTGEGLKHL